MLKRFLPVLNEKRPQVEFTGEHNDYHNAIAVRWRMIGYLSSNEKEVRSGNLSSPRDENQLGLEMKQNQWRRYQIFDRSTEVCARVKSYDR